MNRINFIVFILAILIPFATWAKDISSPITAADIQVLKIAPQDERAVIKTPDGKLQVIKVGDAIGDKGKVIEITDGRVVIEEITDQGTETVIIRFENGRQKVEKIKKTGEKEEPLYKTR